MATTTSAPNNLNQLSSLTTTLSNGPTTSAGLTYDAAGNLKQTLNNDGTRTIYQYDDADRLARIEWRGNAGQLLTVSEFGYDYASRRALTREYDFANGGWSNPQVKWRVFDGLDVVQERNAGNEVTAQLVRDGNIGGILSRTTATGAAFYGYDGNGNVTLLTDSAGQDVGHYRYDAFGNTLEAKGTRAGENPYRFSTKEWHGPSGLYDYGLRFYSPGMGRWLNRDPIREAGGANLYGMVGNNPVSNVDEYGLHIVGDFIDGVKKKINDWLEPPKAKVAPDEDPAEATIKEKEARDKKVVAFAGTGKSTPTQRAGSSRDVARRNAVAAKALPTFTETTVNSMIASSRLPKGKTSRGASLLAKRVADGLLSGVTPTQANADKILRDVLSSPLRTRGTQRAGQIDAIGRSFGREIGVRINTQTGQFIGFRTPDF